MFIHETKIKVRYIETDQMGVVHHANYAQYYEVARTEWMEACSGISYAAMENQGIILPLLDIYSKFLKPAMYNQILTVKSFVKNLPTIRLLFDYEIYNPQKELINIGYTTLVFVNKYTRKPCHPPENFMIKIRPYFQSFL